MNTSSSENVEYEEYMRKMSYIPKSKELIKALSEFEIQSDDSYDSTTMLELSTIGTIIGGISNLIPHKQDIHRKGIEESKRTQELQAFLVNELVRKFYMSK